MSKISDMFKRLGQYLMQAEIPPPLNLTPEVGMSWNLVKHHRPRETDGNRTTVLGHYQIVSVDSVGVGVSERTPAGVALGQDYDSTKAYKIYSHVEWNKVYQASFREPKRSPYNRGEAIVPEYRGILPVPDVSEMHKTGMPFYIDVGVILSGKKPATHILGEVGINDLKGHSGPAPKY